MPQMKPSLWFILYILFLMTLSMITNFTFFLTFNSPSISLSPPTSSYHYPKWNWKW